MEQELEEEMHLSRSITTTSPRVAEGLSMMEQLLVDCPMPSNADFKKMVGIQTALCFRLSLAMMARVDSKKKLDRELLRIQLKLMQMTVDFAVKGSSISE